MAVLVMCSVRDRAVDTFARPFFVPNVKMAIRSFSDEINRADDSNPLFVHPEDYDLYEIGSFDDSDGSVVWLKPKMVCVGKDARAAAARSAIAVAPAKED